MIMMLVSVMLLFSAACTPMHAFAIASVVQIHTTQHGVRQQRIAAGVAGIRDACGDFSHNDSSVHVFVRVWASTGWPHLGACAMAD